MNEGTNEEAVVNTDDLNLIGPTQGLRDEIDTLRGINRMLIKYIYSARDLCKEQWEKEKAAIPPTICTAVGPEPEYRHSEVLRTGIEISDQDAVERDLVSESAVVVRGVYKSFDSLIRILQLEDCRLEDTVTLEGIKEAIELYKKVEAAYPIPSRRVPPGAELFLAQELTKDNEFAKESAATPEDE